MKNTPKALGLLVLAGVFFISYPSDVQASPTTVYLNTNSSIPSPFVQSTWAVISYVASHTGASTPDINADYSYHTWNDTVIASPSAWCPYSTGTYIAEGFAYSTPNAGNFHGGSTTYSDASTNADVKFSYICNGSTWSNYPTIVGTSVVQIVKPEAATTTYSNTVQWSIIYNIDASQIPDGLYVQFRNAVDGSYVYTDDIGGVHQFTDISTSTGLHIYTHTDTIQTGSWIMTPVLQSFSPPNIFVGRNQGLAQERLFSVVSIALAGLDGWDPASFATASSTACAFSWGFNIGNCAAFLFIPNSSAFQSYSSLPLLIQGKFPFSYLYSMKDTWESLVASSTANSPSIVLNLHDLGIGSTTTMGNILPNFTGFSASTTKEYFPTGTFDLLKALASAALILTLFSDIFFTTKNLIRT